MERRKTEHIENVLFRFLRESGLETPLNQYRVVEAWSDVAGSIIASYTKEIYIKNQILYVRLTASALRSNLLMRRKQLTQELNDHVKAFVIADIVFL